ncbi:hypothetical protein Tco_1323877, partial [Tanacetum coccineum]
LYKATYMLESSSSVNGDKFNVATTENVAAEPAVETPSEAHNVAHRTSSSSRINGDFDLCVDNKLGSNKDRTISRGGRLVGETRWVQMKRAMLVGLGLIGLN